MVPDLLGLGHKVTVLDNFMYRQNSLSQVCRDANFQVVNGDARVGDTLTPLLAKADVVIPLAALVGAPICDRDPIGAKTLNLDAQLMLIDRLSKDQRVLMPITNSGYGVGETGKHCTEETPLRPVSPYGRHKVEVEARALERGNTISFRLATVFGMSPRMRIDLLVNDFVYRATYDRTVVLFESHFKRNYIHVRDVSRVFSHGLEHFDAMKGEPYNVGLSEANLSKRELWRTHSGSHSPVRLHRGRHRRGPGQTRLHRIQRQDRGDRLQSGNFPGRRHRRTDQGIHHDPRFPLYQRLTPAPRVFRYWRNRPARRPRSCCPRRRSRR